MQDACVRGLARNLDVLGGSELAPGLGRVIYNVFPLQMSPEALADVQAALSATPRGSLLIHIAEGGPHDASAAREFEQLKALGLLRPGVSLIHAVAIKPDGFAEMAAHGVGFIWSPRSNIELYGDTANVAAAKASGVKIALAPDWSPTGSVGLLGELNYASVWNQTQNPPLFTERDLVLMATTNAAELVNLSEQIGSLAPGHVADMIVVKPRAADHDAYWTLTHSTPEDIDLVVIGGSALYGDAAMMQSFGATAAEPVAICGATKAIAANGKSFAVTEQVLDQALHRQGRTLAPLAECGY
jgi:cytosine/adenosine deaminase-related metal-dependent hydrolase